MKSKLLGGNFKKNAHGNLDVWLRSFATGWQIFDWRSTKSDYIRFRNNPPNLCFHWRKVRFESPDLLCWECNSIEAPKMRVSSVNHLCKKSHWIVLLTHLKIIHPTSALKPIQLLTIQTIVEAFLKRGRIDHGLGEPNENLLRKSIVDNWAFTKQLLFCKISRITYLAKLSSTQTFS